MFRKLIQAWGVVTILGGVYYAYAWGQAMFAGQVNTATGWFFIFLNIFGGCGGGVLLILFDPHKLMQISSTSLYKLVEKPERRPSFAERLTVTEADEKDDDEKDDDEKDDDEKDDDENADNEEQNVDFKD